MKWQSQRSVRADTATTKDWFVLMIGVILAFGPILVIVVSSFKLPRDIFTFRPVVFFQPVLSNYVRLFREFPEFLRALGNSFFITIGACLLTLVLTIPSAYSYSRLYTKRLSRSSFFLIGVRMFPPIIILIPLYPALRVVGLLDKHITMILIYATFQASIGTMILKSFLDGIPKELDEQAMIDGCGKMKSFFRILLPLMGPGLVASVILVSVFAWNDFVFAFLLSGQTTKTAPILIAEMQGLVAEGVFDYGALFAAATVQLLPLLFFIIVVQKRLSAGLTLGAVKG